MPTASQSVRKPSRVYLRRGHPHTQGLVAAYPFFEGSGAGTIHDVSGRQNHGTINNLDLTTDWGLGPWGPALVFDNANNESVTAPMPLSDPSNNWTFIFRIQFEAVSTNNHDNTAGFEDNGGSEFVYVGPNNQDPTVWKILSAGHTPGDSGVNVNNDQWYMGTLTWDTDNTEFEFWEDDTSVQTVTPDTTGWISNLDRVWMGFLSEGDSTVHDPHDGPLAEVRVYNWKLPGALIKEIYEQPLAAYITKPR